MNFKETGFRGLYHQYSVYAMDETVKSLLKDCKGMDDVNGVLVYGFYDREEGLKLEVLAGANIKEGNVTFEVAESDERTTWNLEDVISLDFNHVDDKDNFLAKKYADKLSLLKAYNVPAKLEACRSLAFLDECRDEVSFDDIKVIFNKEGLMPEECLVRIDEQVEGHFVGSLVGDPVQDFGFKSGDKVAFYVAKDQDGAMGCFANFSESAFITEDDLEDGSMLEEAVSRFNKEKGESNLVALLEILRSSYVWMPCRMLSELNVQTDFEDGFSPDLFQKGADYFMPIFSSEEQMKEFATARSKQAVSVMKAVKMASESTTPLVGLVLNPFTEPFVIDMKLCSVIEKMKPIVG